MTLLERMSQEIESRRHDIQRQEAYYDGTLPKLVLSDPYIPSYSAIINQARTPWASLVIDQAAERMAITGFRVITPDDQDTDVEADSLAWDIWQFNSGELYSQQAFATMLLHGVAYMLVEQGTELPLISFEHPSMATTLAAPGGRATVAALKRWRTPDDVELAVMWATKEGRQVYGRAPGQDWRAVPDEDTIQVDRVPMFALRNRPGLLGTYASDLDSLYPTLDRVAQSVADRLTAQLYSSTKVRYLIGVEPDLDENGQPQESTLRLATDRLLLIENENAKAGVFDASDLRQFIEVARADIAALAAISRLPTYLMSGDLVNVSREALESLSQGMVSRVVQRQVWGTPALADGMRYALRLAGDVRVNDPRTRVEPIWAPVLPPSTKDTADAAATLVGAGILPPTAAQDMVMGLTPSERDKVAQYTRADALTAQGVQAITSLFTAPSAEQGTGAPAEIEQG